MKPEDTGKSCLTWESWRTLWGGGFWARYRSICARQKAAPDQAERRVPLQLWLDNSKEGRVSEETARGQQEPDRAGSLRAVFDFGHLNRKWPEAGMTSPD